MTIASADVIDSVNYELRNIATYATSSFEANGTTVQISVAPLSSYLLNDGTLKVYIDGVQQATNTYSVDYDSGIISWTTAVAAGSIVSFAFTYQPYHPDVITAAVDAAPNMMFPFFYKTIAQDETTDGETGEFALDGESVTRVMLLTSGNTNSSLIARRKYETYDGDAGGVIRFFTPPSEGTITIYQIARCAIADLPDRAYAPLVSYACYQSVMNQSALRLRADTAVVTQGSGILSPRQMNDVANAFYMRYQLQLNQMKQKPWSVF